MSPVDKMLFSVSLKLVSGQTIFLKGRLELEKVIAVILAAGESTRMNSPISKLLHKIGDYFLIELPVKACIKAGVGRIIMVVGHQAEKIKEVVGGRCLYVYQEERLGTGDALRKASFLFSSFNGEVLVLPGDAPFVTYSILKDIVRYHREKNSVATILTAFLSDPASYGRVVRDSNNTVKKIVEKKNATPEELRIKEVNSGVYCFDAQKIVEVLPLLRPDKVSGEVYLTDVFEIFYSKGQRVEALCVQDPLVVMGVNTPCDLERARKIFAQKYKNLIN